MKEKVLCFTVEQESDGAAVLQERAQEKGCQLIVVPPFEAYHLSPSVNSEACDPSAHKSLSSVSPISSLSLGIPGLVQRHNASIAVQLSFTWLKRHSCVFAKDGDYGSKDEGEVVLRFLPQEFALGLSSCRWPGR